MATADEKQLIEMIKDESKEDMHKLEVVLNRQPDVNCVDGSLFGLDYTPLHHAAANGKVATATRLLAVPGIQIDKGDDYRQTPLWIAARYGKADTALTLLAAGAAKDAPSIAGITPLCAASYRGNKDAALTLIAAGADVNKADINGETPLMDAAEYGQLELVKLLLAAGANKDLKHTNGRTAMDKAKTDEIRAAFGAPISTFQQEKREIDEAVRAFPARIAEAKRKTAQAGVSIAAAAAPAASPPKPSHPITPAAAAAPTPAPRSPGHAGNPPRKGTLSKEDAEIERAMKKLDEKEAAYNCAKIVFLGRGGAGKTTTIASLMSQLFNPDQPSTVGAVVDQQVRLKVNDTRRWQQNTTPLVDCMVNSDNSSSFDGAAASATSSVPSSPSKKKDSSVDDVLQKRQVLKSAQVGANAASQSAPTPPPPAAAQQAPPPLPTQEEEMNVREVYKNVQSRASRSKGQVGQEPVFSIYDFAGQTVFYDMLPFLMSPFNVYVLCFDMRELIPDVKPKVSESCKRYIREWLNTVQRHAALAPVFIVGTHADQVPKSNDVLMAISTTIHTLITETKAASVRNGARLSFFPVNNTKSNADPGIQTLQTAIEKTVEELPHIKTLVKVRWLACLESLRSKEATRQRLSLEEFRHHARTFNIDEDECRKMLVLLHEFGALLHFDGNPVLRDLVVLDAQWLVSTFTAVIRDFYLHHTVTPLDVSVLTLEDFWNQLRERASLCPELLPSVWPDLSPKERESCLEIMCMYKLAVPFFTQAGTTNFLIPSLLPVDLDSAGQSGSLTDALSDEWISRMEAYKPAPSPAPPNTLTFYIEFHRPRRNSGATSATKLADLSKAGCLPSGLFAHLICALVREQQFAGHTLDDSLLSKCLSVLHFGAVSLELACVQNVPGLRVTIKSADGRRLLQRLRDIIDDVLTAAFQPLQCTVLLPFDAATLIKLDWLQDKLEAAEGVFIHGTRLADADLHRLFPGLLPRPRPDRFDAMISYRWSANKDFVSHVFEQLTGELSTREFGGPIDVFWDEKDIRPGDNFYAASCSALFNCSLALPVVSIQAMERMVELVQADSVDNLLMEWSLMVLLAKPGDRKLAVYPLIVGDGWGNNGKDVAVKYKDMDAVTKFVERLPAIVSTATYNALDAYLIGTGRPAVQLRLSVKQIVSGLLAHRGLECFNIKPNNTAAIADYRKKIVEAVKLHTHVHNLPSPHRKTTVPPHLDPTCPPSSTISFPPSTSSPPETAGGPASSDTLPISDSLFWILANSLQLNEEQLRVLVDTATADAKAFGTCLKRFLDGKFRNHRHGWAVEAIVPRLVGSLQQHTFLTQSDADVLLVIELNKLITVDIKKKVFADNQPVDPVYLKLIGQAFNEAVHEWTSSPSRNITVKSLSSDGMVFATVQKGGEKWDIVPVLQAATGVIYLYQDGHTDGVGEIEDFETKLKVLHERNNNIGALLRMCKIIKATDQKRPELEFLSDLPSSAFAGVAVLTSALGALDMAGDFVRSFRTLLQAVKAKVESGEAVYVTGRNDTLEEIRTNGQTASLTKWLDGWIAFSKALAGGAQNQSYAIQA